VTYREIHFQKIRPIKKICLQKKEEKKEEANFLNSLISVKQMQYKYAIGIDMSFRSPGLAIHDLTQNKWYVYAFAQFKREENTFYCKDNTTVRLFDQIPHSKSEKKKAALIKPKKKQHEDGKLLKNVQRYNHIVAHFTEAIHQHVPAEWREVHSRVNFEEYVFQQDARKRGNNFKLAEIAGSIKLALYQLGFRNIEPIVASSWKRQVVGHGHCAKLHTVQFMRTAGPCVDFLGLCNYSDESLKWDNLHKEYEVPSPAQDMADACAVAMSVYAVPLKKINSLLSRNVLVKQYLDSLDKTQRLRAAAAMKLDVTKLGVDVWEEEASEPSFWTQQQEECKLPEVPVEPPQRRFELPLPKPLTKPVKKRKPAAAPTWSSKNLATHKQSTFCSDVPAFRSTKQSNLDFIVID
jgi:hypothetical protein